jgi:hypothetical protein
MERSAANRWTPRTERAAPAFVGASSPKARGSPSVASFGDQRVCRKSHPSLGRTRRDTHAPGDAQEALRTHSSRHRDHVEVLPWHRRQPRMSCTGFVAIGTFPLLMTGAGRGLSAPVTNSHIPFCQPYPKRKYLVT